MERSARLELAGCDQDVSLVGDGASASNTLSEHWDCGSMGMGDIPGVRGVSGESAGSAQLILD